MKSLNHQIKVLLGLLGVTVNIQAQVNTTAAVQVQELELFESTNIPNATQNFQVVSQEELLNALQNNNLEQLLLKKGILIQKPSADSTICRQTGTGGGD